jgi:hypothetical protein
MLPGIAMPCREVFQLTGTCPFEANFEFVKEAYLTPRNEECISRERISAKLLSQRS